MTAVLLCCAGLLYSCPVQGCGTTVLFHAVLLSARLLYSKGLLYCAVQGSCTPVLYRAALQGCCNPVHYWAAGLLYYSMVPFSATVHVLPLHSAAIVLFCRGVLHCCSLQGCCTPVLYKAVVLLSCKGQLSYSTFICSAAVLLFCTGLLYYPLYRWCIRSPTPYSISNRIVYRNRDIL
jgi:hypothetical protein